MPCKVPCLVNIVLKAKNLGATLQTRVIALEASIWISPAPLLIDGSTVTLQYEPSELGADYSIYQDDKFLGYVDDYRSERLAFFFKLDSFRKATISQHKRSSCVVTIRLESDFKISQHPSLRLVSTAGIYAIKSKICNSIYIGQARNINRRLAQHFSDLSFGLHHNYGLQSLWCEYHATDFTVKLVENLSHFNNGTIEDQRALESRERFWIAQERKSSRICLNETDGEFIETKISSKQREVKAQQRLQISLARETERISREDEQDADRYARRRELRKRLKTLNELIDFEDKKLSPMIERHRGLEQELKNECNIFYRFGLSTRTKRNKVNALREQIAGSSESIKGESSLKTMYEDQVRAIESELKSIVTHKQLRARAKRVRIRLF